MSMEPTPELPDESPLVLPPLPAGMQWLRGPLDWIGWLLRPGPRNVIAWLISIGLAIGYVEYAWYMPGFATCDYGSQWLTARMFVVDNAQGLYLVHEERPVLNTGYDGEKRTDLDWQILTKGHDEPEKVIVEGPLYPPTAGLLFWPIAVLPPKAGHAVMAVLYAQLAFVAGWLLKVITRGRLRTGEGALLTMVFPNLPVAIVLGQNSMLSLFIILAGWALASRGWPLLGGLVWGLFAYKPVFAAALILVPLIQCRWRMLLGMILSGGAFAVATLPFLLPPEERYLWAWSEDQQRWLWVMDSERVEKAFAPWQRWLEVGNHASYMYTYDPNWVWMSRDLTGLPRRAMWDWEHFRPIARFHLGIDHTFDRNVLQPVHSEPELKPFCLSLLVAAGLYTFLVCAGTAWGLRRCGQAPSADYVTTRDAFLLIGALFTTFHFMHYDLMVFALPVALLIDHATRRPLWRRNAEVELALGVTLLTCFLFLACAWHAARYMDAPSPPAPALSTPANIDSTPLESKEKERLLTEVAPNTATHAQSAMSASGKSAAGSSESESLNQVEAPPPRVAPVWLRWLYFVFVGIVLVVFLATWIWTACLQSWLFDAVLWLLFLCSAIDLAYVGPSVRMPFETLLLLIAWVWAGSLTWREALALIRR